MLITLCLAGLACATRPVAGDLPTVTVRSDDTPITASCRIEIPPGLVLADENRNGVIQVVASDLVIEFGPSAVLRGADPSAAPDTYEGYGVRIAGQRHVTVRGGRISGFRAGVWASDAPDLTLEQLDASDGRRARLKSTPEREAGEDWLYPHNNDTESWLDAYGAAIYVERCERLTVRDCKVWHSQNALCLDRVTDSRIYDNDFSFNSGWGIALWRSCRNIISRNACDFCIRGYSHGVYNRGQDSAGLLFFEQDSDNIVAENSATHGGDGFFGYAGHAAVELAAQPSSAPDGARPSPTGVGCDRNLLIRNDFSYAAAHGIELTFSFDNRFIGNRLVGNAICGIWAGYSQGTLILGNEIAENGGAGYGLERGGVNIDSSRCNRIIGNTFRRNVCGVHLWWHVQPPDRAAWARRNLPDWEGNVIAGNVFDADELTFHFRGPGRVTLGPNELLNPRRAMDAAAGTTVTRSTETPVEPASPPCPVWGTKRPVGARAALAGRENIIMTEWGPWDHCSPLVVSRQRAGPTHTFELRGFSERPRCTVEGVRDWRLDGAGPDYALTLTAADPGVYPYTASIAGGAFRHELRGALFHAVWDVTCFPHDGDPVADAQAWRASADSPAARRLRVPRLDDPALLTDGAAGAADTASEPSFTSQPNDEDRAPPARGFVARTRVPVPPGGWQISVTTSGGVRVIVNGRPVIDAWRRSHGERSETGRFTAGGRPVDFTVEYFTGRRLSRPILNIVPAEEGRVPD